VSRSSEARVFGHRFFKLSHCVPNIIGGCFAGRIRANLQARSIVVEGRVDGNLYGLERAELKKSATVVGDIYTPRIAIEDGAFLEGDVRVHKDAPRPQTKKEAATFSGRAKVA